MNFDEEILLRSSFTKPEDGMVQPKTLLRAAKNELKEAKKILPLLNKLVPKIVSETNDKGEVVSLASGLNESDLMKSLINGYYCTEVKKTEDGGGREAVERVQKEHVEKGWPWGGVVPPAYIPPGRFEVQVCYISHLCFSLTY